MPKVSCKPQNLKIYNRWGKLIYDRNDYISEFKGENLSGGTYYYLLKDTDNRSWKGWLEIKK